MSATFTCITCRVAFADADLQRGHYKSDWHRYNLKRKVAELPPVTAEGFIQRLLAQKAQIATEQPQNTSNYCDVCHKSFNSAGAYQSHLQSSKHRQATKNLEETSLDDRRTTLKTTSSTDKHEKSGDVKAQGAGAVERSEEETSGDVKTQGAGKEETSGDVKTRRAGAVARDEEEKMETDEDEGTWDDEALGLEECLFCGDISETMEENVKHMTTVHSFFIPDIEYLVDMEGFLTYLGQKVGVGKMCIWCNERTKAFYSTKAVQQHMLDKGHCRLLHDEDAAYEYTDFYDYTKSYPDGESPDVDSNEEIISPEALALAEEEYELALPSGAKIGHRALLRYYKQNLATRTNTSGQAVRNAVSHYKALGWTGATGPLVERRKKDLAYVQRQKQKYMQKLGIKSNKTLQMHFRQQVMY